MYLLYLSFFVCLGKVTIRFGKTPKSILLQLSSHHIKLYKQ